MPIWVIAGEVTVGELTTASGIRGVASNLREPEVEDLDDAVGPDFDVRRLQVAVDDALLVRGLERVGDLPRDFEGFVGADRPAGDALGEILAFHELHHERRIAGAILQSVDVRNVWVVQRSQGVRLTLEAPETIRIRRERSREEP